MNRKHKWEKVTVVISLLLLTIVLGSCNNISVSVQDATSSPKTENSARASRNPVSIVGVDFDPPLRYTEAIARQGVTMLVAVENYSPTETRDILVTAELSRANAPHTVVLQRQAYIDHIAPGQVLVERFPRLSVLLRKHQYRLSVQISPYRNENRTQTVYDQRIFLVRIGADK